MFMKWSTGAYKFSKLLLVVALIFTILPGCSLFPKEEEEEVIPVIAPPPISKKPEYKVERGNIQEYFKGKGEMVSLREQSLSFKIEGKEIKKIHVKAGDKVTEGQLLAELEMKEKDEKSIELRILQKKLEVEDAKNNLVKVLRGEDVSNEQEDDNTAELNREIQVEEAKLLYEIKKQEYEDLIGQANDAKITAPFAGEVINVYRQEGDTSIKNQSVIFVADTNQLVVGFKTTEDKWKDMYIGQEVKVEISGAAAITGKIMRLPITDDNQNNNNNYYGGRYDSQEKKPEEKIKEYVLIELPKVPDSATRGMRASVSVLLQEKVNVLYIPPASLRTYGGRNYVKVIDKEGNKREVDVEVGMQTATKVEIISGLEEGQIVEGR
ncbi:efflux RND transporter periplasmic adaptor subunit [Rubeoparvulum massiliense]|uniref:efflux RND transporter periplasmic adaptor subunit n=1 Tax=Rubeoparvulum massiliense TaxID=1631346 RepID=UPI00065E71F5|nr:efflux RND transporter periplasmic adaptor subunit [Rubeoparvulum massiliense]